MLRDRLLDVRIVGYYFSIIVQNNNTGGSIYNTAAIITAGATGIAHTDTGAIAAGAYGQIAARSIIQGDEIIADTGATGGRHRGR